MVSPLVFSTRNIIIGLVAVCNCTFACSSVSSERFRRSSVFSSLSCCNCSIAFSPSGVAALSSPSMFAATFMKMLPVAGCPLGMSGKSLVNTGDKIRASMLTTPPRSPIFIMPSHRASIPVRPSEISKAVFEVSNVEFIIAGNTSVSPRNTNLTNAMTNAIRKNAIQM